MNNDDMERYQKKKGKQKVCTAAKSSIGQSSLKSRGKEIGDTIENVPGHQSEESNTGKCSTTRHESGVLIIK